MKFCSCNLKTLLIGVFSLGATVAQAQVFDSYSAEIGRGVQSNIYKLGAQKNISGFSSLADYHLYPYWELTVAQVNQRRYQDTLGQKHSLYILGITPVLRWQQEAAHGIFAEIGIGANYFTDKYDNAGKTASTRFQFGDHVGVGYKFSNSAEVTLKYLHYSNAGIKHPNPAMNFTLLKFAYGF